MNQQDKLKQKLVQKTEKELKKEVANKSDDELFDMSFVMIDKMPASKDIIKKNLIKLTSIDIKERTKRFNTNQEILEKYTKSDKFMKLWHLLDLKVEDLIEIVETCKSQPD